MTQGVPGLVWGLLIIFACALIGCMLVFAAEASISKAVLVGVFASSLTLALLTVRLLDYPFESSLQLPSRDFNETEHLITTVQPVARERLSRRRGWRPPVRAAFIPESCKSARRSFHAC